MGLRKILWRSEKMITFVGIVGLFSALISFIGFWIDVSFLLGNEFVATVFFECLVNLFLCLYTAFVTVLLIKFHNTGEEHDKEISELKKSVRQLKQQLGIELSPQDFDKSPDTPYTSWDETQGSWFQDDEGKWHYQDNNESGSLVQDDKGKWNYQD